MRTVLKSILWITAIAASIGVVLVTLLFFLDVDLLRPQIERQLSATLGRTIELDGPLELERSLTPRIVIRNLSIGNPHWAHTPELASADSLEIRVGLLDLLAGQLTVEAITAHGVVLNVEKHEDGRNNFTFSASGASGELPAVRRMELHNAQVSYRAPDHPGFSLSVKQAVLHARAAVHGADLTAEYEIDIHAAAVTGQEIRLSGDIGLGREGTIDISRLKASIGHSDIRGSIGWDPGLSPPVLSASLRSRQLDPEDFIAGEDHPGEKAPLSAEAFIALLHRPLDTGPVSGLDLDIDLHVAQLVGKQVRGKNIQLSAEAKQDRLQLGLVGTDVQGLRLSADVLLPWGSQLAGEPVTPASLLTDARIELGLKNVANPPLEVTQIAGQAVSLSLQSIRARSRPGTPTRLEAEALLDQQPVSLGLQGEELGTLLRDIRGPWQNLALQVKSRDFTLEASGSLANPLEPGGLDVIYSASGSAGELLPLPESWSIQGRYIQHPDHHALEDSRVVAGNSDLEGTLRFYPHPPRLQASLTSNRVDLDELMHMHTDNPGSPDSLQLPGFRLDLDLHIAQLDGPDIPVSDLQLEAHTHGDRLVIEPFRALLDDIPISARVELPWGQESSAARTEHWTARRLLARTGVEIQLEPSARKLFHDTTALGAPVSITLDNLVAKARPGERVTLDANAAWNEIPLQVTLRGEPLAMLADRPSGPWRDLSVDIRGEGLKFQAEGQIARPLQAAGLDARFRLQGKDIENLLPLFNFVLPLSGAYSVTGQFKDRPERILLEELRFVSGQNDIGGTVIVQRGAGKPRLLAELESRQLYLEDLLPVDKHNDLSTGAPRRMIPDYTLPIERMHEINGRIRFHAKRLRTHAGDLGDIRFTAILDNSVLKVEPFSVRGWAGAMIDSDITVDASQQPARMAINWTARQLNYGVLLEHSGLAENVEGDIDITLRLEGTGRTRHEILSDANGQLIIAGREGRFGSRRLDLWGADLVTTMLSSEWRQDDVTEIRCLLAQVDIEDGIARSDTILVDTSRITIAATGAVDLESEEIDMVFAPRPRRASLISLTNPVRVTGTLLHPQSEITALPRNRMAAAGTGLLAGLINPGYLIFTFSQTGTRQSDRCATAIEHALALKSGEPVATPAPRQRRFSLLPGCTRSFPEGTP